MSATFSVKNFQRFQHYKDRSPPWIKLYNETLDDYDFSRLPDASKMHLVAIWLLASRSDNKIPYDPAWIARRINATEPVNLEELASAGFIIVEQARSKPLAKRKQSAMPEREGEGQVEQRRGEKSVAPADLTEAAFEAFKVVATECNLPIPTKLTGDRRKHLAARLAEHGPEGWQRAMDKLAASGFCRGDGERRWKADLDFVLQPKSFNRLIDGGYDNHGTPADDLLQQVRAGLAESTDDQPNGHGNYQALHSDADREDVGAASPPRLEHPGSGLDRDVLPNPGRSRPH